MNELLENSLWTDTSGRDKFIADQRKVVDTFWLSLLGAIAILQASGGDTRARRYFMDDNRLRIQSIDETNKDSSLIVKVMVQKKLLPQSVANELTRFLVIMKQGKIKNIDEKLIRGMFNKIPFAKARPSTRLRDTVKDFLDGSKTLSEIVLPMARFAKKEELSGEFITLYKQLRSKMKIAPEGDDAADSDAKASDSPIAGAMPGATPAVPLVDVKTDIAARKDWYAKLWKMNVATFTTELKRHNVTIDELRGWVEAAAAGYPTNVPTDVDKFLMTSDAVFAESGFADNAFLRIIYPQTNNWRRAIWHRFMEIHEINLEALLDNPDFLGLAFFACTGYGESSKASHIFGRYSYSRFFDANKVRFAMRNKISKMVTVKPFYELINATARTWEDNERPIDDNVSTLFAHFFANLKEPSNFVLNASDAELIWLFHEPKLLDIFKYEVWSNINNDILVRRRLHKLNLLDKITTVLLSDMSLEDIKTKGITEAWLTNWVRRDLEPAILQYIDDEFSKAGRNWQVFEKNHSFDFSTWISLIVNEIMDGNKTRENSKLILELGVNYNVEWGVKTEASSHLLRAMWPGRFNDNYTIDSLSEEEMDVYFAYIAAHAKEIGTMALEPNFAGRNIWIHDRTGWTKMDRPIKRATNIILKEIRLYRDRFQLFNYHVGNSDAGDEYLKYIVDNEPLWDVVDEAFSAWANTSNFRWGRDKYFKQMAYVIEKKAHIPRHAGIILDGDDGPVYFGERSKGSQWKHLSPILFSTKMFASKVLADRLMGDEGFGSFFVSRNYDDPAVGDTNTILEFGWPRSKVSQYIDIWEATIGKRIQSMTDRFNNAGDDPINDKFAAGRVLSIDEMINGLTNDNPEHREVFQTVKAAWLRAFGLNRKKPLVRAELDTNRSLFLSNDAYKDLEKISDQLTPAQLLRVREGFFITLNDLTQWQKENSAWSIVDSLYRATVDYDDATVNRLVESTPEHDRRWFANQVKNNMMIGPALDAMKHSTDAHTIKPLVEMSDSEIKQVLKFNNMQVKRGPIKKETEDWSDFFRRARQHKMDDTNMNVKAVEDVQPPEILEQRSARYDQQYFSGGRHGNVGLEIVRSFDVALPDSGFVDFKSQNPTFEYMPTVFHGTGSVAASMILRFGFRIVPSSHMKAGRMLGNGIYFSTAIDKAGQYVGDSGFTRRHGTQGYLLEMEAVLGNDGTHYKTMGHGSDTIRSPEWCVFYPHMQLRITRAHLVKIVGRDYITDLNKKHPYVGPDSAPVTEGFDFKKMLSEALTKQPKNVITYTFMNGWIPDGTGEGVPFEQYKLKSNMRIEFSQLGPALVIDTNKNVSGNIIVPSTKEFIDTDPKGLYSQFLAIVGD